MSRWLNWEPNQPEIIEKLTQGKPTKPSKPNFEGSEGSVSGEALNICGPDLTAEKLAHISSRAPHQPNKALDRETEECPYTLPKGVKLIRYTQKNPPVAVTVCSVVDDIPKFIRHALAGLDARLHNPVQIRAGDSTFELLSKLADCGLELRIEWAPQTQTIEDSPEFAPGKPSDSKVTRTKLDLTDGKLPR